MLNGPCALEGRAARIAVRVVWFGSAIEKGMSGAARGGEFESVQEGQREKTERPENCLLGATVIGR